jgi:DNA-binding NtrC family response regulator
MSDKARDFRVLVIDDERLYAEAIAREVRRLGMGCDVVLTAADGLARSAAERYDLVLLDHKLPDDDGIRIIPIVLARQPHASLVMMTAYQAIPSAIQAIRQGADDYIVKQTSLQPIVAAVVEARRRIALRDASAGWWDEHEQGGLLGASPAIARVREQIARVASRSDTTVLLTGETGVGKEVAARMLHARSSPAGTPLVVVDCVALPGTLVESLLFGHEKGAFTGADRARNGAFHEAGEGTIFLDEIGEMDLALQG